MRFKYLALMLLLFISTSKAENTVKKDILPIDLIELLGELDEADTASLGIALSKTELKKTTEKLTVTTPTTTAVKKSPIGGEK